MKRFAIATLLLLSNSACSSSRPSPLADLGEITSAQLTVLSDTASTETLTDPATLAALRALATARGAWKPTWHTPPAGQVRAALYRDTTYLGVISIGPDFIGARGASAEQFRPIAPSEATTAATFRAHTSKSACAEFPGTSDWTIAVSSPDGNRIDGVLSKIAGRLRITGTLTTREGAGEPLDYPIDSLRTQHDSVHFMISPSQIRLAGSCVSMDSVRTRFEMPQPPFGPIRGSGTITRIKR